MYDILIIGGGPVGSYLASRLAEAGDEVLVLERKENLSEQICCTGIVSRECIDSFAIDKSVILKWLSGAKIYSPSGRLLKLWRDEPQACILDRVAFNQAMVNQAQSRGAQYRLSCFVRDVQISNDRAKVEVSQGGERLNFEARMIVIATGLGSNLAERVGLGRVSDFAIGAQTEVETYILDEVEVYLGQKVTPGFFAWLVPISSQRALVGLLARSNPELYLKKLISSLTDQKKISSVKRQIISRGASLKPRAKTYGKRLIAIGDAAGQVKPITGGGIYYGLLSADIAADTLHQALKTNDLSAGNLAQYERKWQQRLARELRVDYYARLLYQHLSDRQIDRFFNFVISTGIDKTLLESKDLSFDWHAKAILRALRVSGQSIISKPLKTIKALLI